MIESEAFVPPVARDMTQGDSGPIDLIDDTTAGGTTYGAELDQEWEPLWRVYEANSPPQTLTALAHG